MTSLLLQAAALSPEIKPLNDDHIRDIGCVAIIGLVANQQRLGNSAYEKYGSLSDKGSILAADVGEKILEETDQSPEVIAIAMQESAREQWRLVGEQPTAELDVRMQACLPLLENVEQDKKPPPVTKPAPITVSDYKKCAAIISLALDREDKRIISSGLNGPLLFENLIIRYRQGKYKGSTTGQVFARADILKEKQVQSAQVSFSDTEINRCLTIGR